MNASSKSVNVAYPKANCFGGGKNIAAGSNLLALSRPPTKMETSTFKNIVCLQQTVIAINIEHHIATWTDPLRKRAPRRKAIPSAGVTLKDDAQTS